MIKEKPKITKYNYNKPLNLVIAEYAKTVFLSVLFAALVTSLLAIHARHEMIKNIYESSSNKTVLEKQLAKKLIESDPNLLNDMNSKSAAICFHIGELYEAAGDFSNAEMAYKFTIDKAGKNEYSPYYNQIRVLCAQEKIEDAENILNSIDDISDKRLIKFKTKSFILIGDKYYSNSKFISAAKNYEKADFYYNKFSKKDKVIVNSIKKRILNSYLHTADVLVKMGYNSDAVNYLKKVEKFSPGDLKVKYKLAIILSDSDPEQAVLYLDNLISKIPQDIDYGVYCSALMKAANIADLDGRPTKAKYYRYKITALDAFVKRKVIYKNDIDTIITAFRVKKKFFTYPLKVSYRFINNSPSDLTHLYGDFVLNYNDNETEIITKKIAGRDKPLIAGDEKGVDVNLKFKKAIFTKNELKNYTIKIYLYKDDKFKTLVAETKVPDKSFDLLK